MTEFIPPGTPESQEKFRKFVTGYGLALAAWAQLEDALSYLFGILVQCRNGKMYRALFFSGRSFATRADLYSAAIRTAEVPEELERIHKALLKKARQFSSARNAIAHGIPTNLFGRAPNEGFRLKGGDKLWEQGGVSEKELDAAAANFIALQKLVRDFTFHNRLGSYDSWLAQ